MCFAANAATRADIRIRAETDLRSVCVRIPAPVLMPPDPNASLRDFLENGIRYDCYSYHTYGDSHFCQLVASVANRNGDGIFGGQHTFQQALSNHLAAAGDCIAQRFIFYSVLVTMDTATPQKQNRKDRRLLKQRGSAARFRAARVSADIRAPGSVPTFAHELNKICG